ncbi:hypothetical protein BCR34DRAFT_531057 [Clohesyomyces aquaticus]|uniref:Carrier domain-containing protein n=1 Tax=Clohesyomyces aquaticus TaxID=1231657 RepID=A0A1Y2A384_9PLEO|nr:hypothetical protein BCR34DRAFT_531057 [Clohesyomyces aquaticus]
MSHLLARDRSTHEALVTDSNSLLHDLLPCHIPSLLDGSPSSLYDFQEVSIFIDARDLNFENFCSCLEVTPRNVIQSAWAIVVGIYAGTEDVSFGDFTSHEASSQDASVQGFHVRRTQIHPTRELHEIMVDLARQVGECGGHGQSSTADILSLPKFGGKLPFNTVLHVHYGKKSSEDAFLVFGQGMRDDDSIQYDVRVRVRIEKEDNFTIFICTRTSKFSSTQTGNFAHTMKKALIECIKSERHTTIGEIDVVSEQDLKSMVSWNEPSPRSVDVCVHRYFEGVAQMTPDAPSICSKDGTLTYRQLEMLACKLSGKLKDLGVVPEMAVPFCFNKSAIAVVAMLAILKAGGAFVAIDPSYPLSRIETIVKATKASIAIVEPIFAHLFQGTVNNIFTTDLSSVSLLDIPSRRDETSVSPLNAAYMVFTSGSTGVPKGIVVEHRALSTAALSLAPPMRITSRSRVLQFAAHTFDASIGDIFVTLLQGGCVCVPSEDERSNDLAGAIMRMNVTAACLTPSVVRILHPSQVPCIKTISCGGEMLLQEILDVWAGKIVVVNLYGPSECTIWCTANTHLSEKSLPNNIGRPLGAQLWVTRPDNPSQLCPIGSVGELLIEGPVLARGYLDSEQTNRAFVENLSWANAEPGQPRRFYRTGDLVRYNSNGSVTFIGRKDSQVKVHGHRIELGEVEHHLSMHESIRQSIVIVPNSGRHAKQLVAVVAFNTTKALDLSNSSLEKIAHANEKQYLAEVAHVKDFLHSKIPPYMVPQFWVMVNNIPLITSGKLNRVLAKRFVEDLAEDLAEKPANETNTDSNDNDPLLDRLVDIWSQVFTLSRHDIGITQNFESLGGDSLMAMALVARSKEAGFAVTVEDILKNNTIQQMTSLIKKRLPETNADAKVSNAPTDVQSPLIFGPIWWNISM